MSGGLLTASGEYIGDPGSGSFTQSGGTNSIYMDNYLCLGFSTSSSGTYSLSGSGLLFVPYFEYIGNSGSGSFSQMGGVHSVSYLVLGGNYGSGTCKANGQE